MQLIIVKAFFISKSSPILGFDVVANGYRASMMLCGCRVMGGKIHVPGAYGERKKFFQHGLMTRRMAATLYGALETCLRDPENDPLKLGPDRFKIKLLPCEAATEGILLTDALGCLFPEKGFYTCTIPDPDAEKEEYDGEEEDEYVVGS
jgi:hypothetical protein